MNPMIKGPYSLLNPGKSPLTMEALYPNLHYPAPRLLKGKASFDAGQSDYLAQATANFTTGQQPYPVTQSRFLALFTVAPTSDAGTGGTEVSGGSYARVQIAGQLTANGAFTTSSTSITLSANAPAWLAALGTAGINVNVFDSTASILTNIGTINGAGVSTGSTSVPITTASHASSGTADTLMFSAFNAAAASSGTEPAVTPVSVTNQAAITFPAATANWGTVIAFAIYDAVSSGNMLMWDYIGNFNWLPCSISSASPATVTSHAHGYSNGDAVVATAKFGGFTPSFSQSNFTPSSTDYCLKATSTATDTFTVTNNGTAVNTSSTGDMMFRKIIQQSIPSGVTASFAASTLTLNVA